MEEEGLVQVVTAMPDRESAAGMARAAVESGMAACVQVSGPVESTYRWKGAVESAEEWMCAMKTTSGTAAALVAFVGERHPYETPEILVFPCEGSASYAAWVEESTGPGVDRK